jgi:hypothetical protein
MPLLKPVGIDLHCASIQVYAFEGPPAESSRLVWGERILRPRGEELAQRRIPPKALKIGGVCSNISSMQYSLVTRGNQEPIAGVSDWVLLEAACRAAAFKPITHIVDPGQ